MVEHDAVDEVLTAVSRYRYRSRTGPLWCVKVLIGYPANGPPMLVRETVSRPDTGIGTSPESENQDLLPRPDTGFGAHPSERFQCRPLIPEEVIEMPLHDPNRCVILPPLAPQPDPGQEVQYDPMMGAAGIDGEDAIGDNLPPFVPDYAADPSGYNEPGAGPSGYGGQHDHDHDLGEEEAYGSRKSDGRSPTGDQNAPDVFPSEPMDPFRPGRPMAERASASEPYSRPSSNPSSASSASISSQSTQVAPSAGAGAVK